MSEDRYYISEADQENTRRVFNIKTGKLVSFAGKLDESRFLERLSQKPKGASLDVIPANEAITFCLETGPLKKADIEAQINRRDLSKQIREQVMTAYNDYIGRKLPTVPKRYHNKPETMVYKK
jgi:bifunctional DNA-binding transcriptional regulator/antitoxin component of YhaV-PrlF toxin-antitoxin module